MSRIPKATTSIIEITKTTARAADGKTKMIFSRPCGIIFHGKRKGFSEVRAQTDRLTSIISVEQTQRNEIAGLEMEHILKIIFWRGLQNPRRFF